MNDTSQPRNREHYPDIDRHRSAIAAILRRTGTPILICERENLIDRYRELDRSLSSRWPDHVIAYSFKTNYLVARTGIFRRLGGWAEVVSGREYRMARELGFPGNRIIFNGPYKPDADLRTAMEDRATVNVNDYGELERIAKLATAASAPVPIGLRLAARLPHVGESRFGFPLDDEAAAQAVETTDRNPQVTLAGVHLHLYADTDDPELYRAGVERMGCFLRDRVPDYQHRLQWVNLGGGFPAHIEKPKSRSTWNPLPIDKYIQALTETLAGYFPDCGNRPTVVVEPGRYLTADGILLVSEVVYVEERGGKQVVNTNASISMVPLTHYCPQIIGVYDADLVERQGPREPSVVYGATCRENDVLYDGSFPRARPGDYLVHFAVGAYNSSLSPDFIFAAPGMELL